MKQDGSDTSKSFYHEKPSLAIFYRNTDQGYQKLPQEFLYLLVLMQHLFSNIISIFFISLAKTPARWCSIVTFYNFELLLQNLVQLL